MTHKHAHTFGDVSWFLKSKLIEKYPNCFFHESMEDNCYHLYGGPGEKGYLSSGLTKCECVKAWYEMNIAPTPEPCRDDNIV